MFVTIELNVQQHLFARRWKKHGSLQHSCIRHPAASSYKQLVHLSFSYVLSVSRCSFFSSASVRMHWKREMVFVSLNKFQLNALPELCVIAYAQCQCRLSNEYERVWTSLQVCGIYVLQWQKKRQDFRAIVFALNQNRVINFHLSVVCMFLDYCAHMPQPE